MTIFMPISNLNNVSNHDGNMGGGEERLFYEWVGTFFRVARTYKEYITNRESRKRYLYLKKLSEQGRVKRKKVDGNGFIYNDYKLKYSFYVENTLVVDTRRQPRLFRVGEKISQPEHVEIYHNQNM